MALAWVGCRADDEKICEGGGFPKIEDLDMFRLLRFRAPNRHQPVRNFGFGSGVGSNAKGRVEGAAGKSRVVFSCAQRTTLATGA